MSRAFTCTARSCAWASARRVKASTMILAPAASTRSSKPMLAMSPRSARELHAADRPIARPTSFSLSPDASRACRISIPTPLRTIRARRRAVDRTWLRTDIRRLSRSAYTGRLSAAFPRGRAGTFARPTTNDQLRPGYGSAVAAACLQHNARPTWRPHWSLVAAATNRARHWATSPCVPAGRRPGRCETDHSRRSIGAWHC